MRKVQRHLRRRLDRLRNTVKVKALSVYVGTVRRVFGLTQRRPTPATVSVEQELHLAGGEPGTSAATGEAAFLPIVFIHRKNSPYLRHTLEQARTSNPESTISLLGDDSNRSYPGIKHHLFNEYSDSANNFANLYQHFNTTRYNYSLFDFQRWFRLRDWLHHSGLNRCLYLDSDIMLYANATTEYEHYRTFALSLSRGFIPCTVFISHIEILDEFCRFLNEIYGGSRPYEFDQVVARFALRQKNGLTGGACDMTAFELFREENFGAIGEVSLVRNGSVFDPGICILEPGFEMENGIKKVEWLCGEPHGFYQRTGERIRFNSLHFQGQTKPLIPRFRSSEHLPERSA